MEIQKDQPLRLTRIYRIIEDYINQDLSYKYRLKELIDEYKFNSIPLKYEKVRINSQILIKIKNKDFKFILDNLNEENDEIELFFKDYENLKLKITSYNKKTDYFEINIKNEEKLNQIPDEGEIFYNKFSGDEYQTKILINALNDIKNLSNKNFRNFINSISCNENQLKLKNQNYQLKILDIYEPSKDQKKALTLYCANVNFLAITGDAGTGKSLTLLDILKKEIDSGKRVLCIAQSHKIVDQYLNELKDFKKGHYLYCRIAKNEKKIQKNLQDYSSESYYKASYKSTLELLNEKIHIQENLDYGIIEIQKEWRNYLSENPRIFKRLNLYSAEGVFSTTMGFYYYFELFTKLIPFDLIIFDEGSLISFPEFIAFLQFGKKWIIAGDDNQLHQFFNRRIKNLIIPNERVQDWESKNILNHLDSILLEKYIGINTLKRLTSYKLRSCAEGLFLLKYNKNFRLPDMINDIFIIAKKNFHIENIPDNIKLNLGEYVEFIKTDELQFDAEESISGHSNYLEARITIEVIDKLVEEHINIEKNIIIGIGAAWKEQIDVVSNKLIERKKDFQSDEDGHYFESKKNKNIKIIIDTFWSLASKNIDYLIWNFVKCRYLLKYNKYKIANGIFKGLYSDNPNLFNCFLKRFKKKLIIIGNYQCFNNIISEMKNYIKFAKSLIESWREYVVNNPSIYNTEEDPVIRTISVYEQILTDFETIHNVFLIMYLFNREILYHSITTT